MSEINNQDDYEYQLDELRKQAGLKIWDEDEDGEKEWVGTQKQWREFNSLWEAFDNQ